MRRTAFEIRHENRKQEVLEYINSQAPADLTTQEITSHVSMSEGLTREICKELAAEGEIASRMGGQPYYFSGFASDGPEPAQDEQTDERSVLERVRSDIEDHRELATDGGQE
jgi:hypothetical protein